MVRELKFRSWDGEKFHYFTMSDLINNSLQSLFPRHMGEFPIIQMAIGKVDKTGRDIYDGDIVSAPFSNGRNTGTRRTKNFCVRVKWHPTQYSLEFPDDNPSHRYYPRMEDCTVVSNIMENPDMGSDTYSE